MKKRQKTYFFLATDSILLMLNYIKLLYFYQVHRSVKNKEFWTLLRFLAHKKLNTRFKNVPIDWPIDFLIFLETIKNYLTD